MTRHPIAWFIVGAIALAVLLLVVPAFFPWTPLNCQHQDVDIMTGRLRFTRYLLFCKVSERVKDSPLTKVLAPEMVLAATPEWHRVNTFSPGVGHSPHYIFHSAIHQIHTLSDIWEMSELYGFRSELRQSTALHVLALWQHSGDDFLAGNYIQCLFEGLSAPTGEDKREQILKVLPTLQMPLVEKNGSEVIRTVFYPNGQAMDRVHGYIDASGNLIRHGVWEAWWPNGARSEYGHFENGDLHGLRFEWDRSGYLSEIQAFNRGQLSSYDHDNLEQHPDYKALQELLAEDKPKPSP